MSSYILFTESSPNVGGQELQLMQQMRQLAQLGYQPVLACRPGSRVAAVAQAQGLQVLPVRFRNSVHLPSIAILRRWMATHRPRLAICHSGHDSNNLAMAARLVRHRPFLLRSRTYQPGKASAWSYNRLVDATMLPSQYLRDALLQNPAIQPERLHVVYPGIDFERIDQDAHAALPLPVQQWLHDHPGPLLVQAAMLRGEKGHQTILQAMALLVVRWPQLRYVIAGEGPELAHLQSEITRLGLAEHVLLAGMVQPVAALLARADLVLMPSSYEPLGMSQIEALGLGVPVLASRTGGIPETITDGQTGCLLPPGEVQAWASAIDHALLHPDKMQNLAQAGCQDVRHRFSPHTNTARLLALAGLAATAVK
jgi:glycosyltransferase involved in cell wall biosynthesis